MRTIDASHVGAAPAGSGAGSPARAPGDPLDLMLSHLRGLLRIDAAVLFTVDRDRSEIEPTAYWFSSPDLGNAVAPALNRAYDHNRPGLVEAAIERGRPLLLPKIEDWEAARHPRHHLTSAAPEGEAWEMIRQASAISCPVRTPLGRTLGALVVLSRDPRRPLGKSDLDVVTVLADLAALARERSELLADEAARAREELLLKRAAEGTAGSLEPHEVEAQVVAHAIQIVGADHGQLSRIQPGSRRLVAVAQVGQSTGVEAATVGEVARKRSPLLLSGDKSSIHVPLELGPRLFGVLSLTRERGPGFDRDDLALVMRVARISAAALANAHDFQQERHLARTLTHGFVPESLPSAPGWDVGVLYEPADDQPTGGDLYGAWTLPNGDLAVLIGDVAGKGVETSALSAMARFFIEARSWDQDDPAEVLELASAMLHRRLPSDRFVTAFLGYLDRRKLRYVNAGHLAPLVLHADGAMSEASVGGLPLGIEEQPDYEPQELDLAPEDVLFAFTDGLVEARRGGELLGSDGLRRVLADAAAMTRDPEALTELVHDEVRAWASGLRDDTAIVAVRRRGLSLID